MPFPLSRFVSENLQLIAGRIPKLFWCQMTSMRSKRANDGNELQARMCDTQDPDASPRKNALHSYCRLDKLKQMRCSVFPKKKVSCALNSDLMHHDGR